MGDIFRQSSHVIAWLGPEKRGDNSALALNHLSTCHDDPYSRQSLFTWEPGTSDERKAIGRLCDRSYFQRMWIVQECVLARKLHLVSGLQYCSWEYLYKFSRLLGSEHRGELVAELFDTKELFERNWNGMSIQDTMKDIVSVALGRDCSQFHDRIYGLLGILQQSFQSTGIVVDYAVRPEELMINIEEFLNYKPESGFGHTVFFL